MAFKKASGGGTIPAEFPATETTEKGTAFLWVLRPDGNPMMLRVDGIEGIIPANDLDTETDCLVLMRCGAVAHVSHSLAATVGGFRLAMYAQEQRR